VFTYLNDKDVNAILIKTLDRMWDKMKLINDVWTNDTDPAHTSTEIVAY
jgi:hypothetical protein